MGTDIKMETLSLNVLERGTGEPALLFLHCWGGSTRTWNRVIEQLCSTFRRIAYDQPGWGESDAPADGYAISALAGDAAALICTLGSKRYVLVGHSMGGKAAQFLTAQRPMGLEALILVAPASPLPQHIPEALREAQLHAYDTRDGVLQAIAFLTARPPDESTVEQIVEDSPRGSAAARLAWPSSAAYEDISERVKDINVPTLRAIRTARTRSISNKPRSFRAPPGQVWVHFIAKACYVRFVGSLIFERASRRTVT